MDADTRPYNFTWRAIFGSKRARVVLLLLTLILCVSLLLPYAPSRSLPHFPKLPKPEDPPPKNDDQVDWSQFAYSQYATNPDYLCNSVMIFTTLKRLGVKADRILLYPQEWPDNDPADPKSGLLIKARDELGVKLRPISVLQESADPTWGASFTKLLAFNQTDYRRVLNIDSDSTIFQSMDELFLFPSAKVALTRAYWLDNFLSSQLILLEPSATEFARIQESIKNKKPNDFDMEIVNYLYKDHCMILPHRPYNLLTGEFRGDKHAAYLGSEEEVFDPEKILKETKLVHFSDWPYPKPWINASKRETERLMPECKTSEQGGEQDCRNQKTWLWLYSDFKERRKNVCGSDF
ncbi:glucose N-acetyltransferase 1 [Coccidioides immitis RS]|uniref:Glucose N-acetyltransferase 1 n=3 Tax=Coccidioides immitis TaxID=5501 RepID=A0A0E1RVJ6_COCIM|nr:glucose N-acetyltransferase 1 [Coccidioides immitis RS]EAS27424.1 glucose N-acetyltransferase 1 [Coccidioides immitis RS]KMP09375.1 glucose N-acetyltransferase 1 [Coccidioides immitis RMSCC 2394]KMU75311.1 glucose N-acetyltransferase 1 [Coccidioides immitis RMSCC 3703]